MSEDLGLVWLHVVSPPDIENDLASVSENWGNFGGSGDEAEVEQRSGGPEHALEPQRRARRCASRSGSTTSCRGAARR